MANVTLQAASLLDAARKMEDAAKEIDTALQHLDTTMSDLDAVWSDKNSKKYLERYTELKEDFPKFQNAVHGYSAFLNAVVETYRKEFVEPVSTSVN